MSEPTVLVVTGHRPKKLGGYSDDADVRLRTFARNELKMSSPSTVITGMALGWDQAIAWSCIDLRVPFIAAVPFAGQDSTWPADSRRLYRELLSLAAETVVVGRGGYSAQAMHRRNWYMVDRGTRVLALWDGSSGGTANCVGYALTRKKPIDNCWLRWTRWALTA